MPTTTGDDDPRQNERDEVTRIGDRARAAVSSEGREARADQDIEQLDDLINTALDQARRMYDLMQRLADLLEQGR